MTKAIRQRGGWSVGLLALLAAGLSSGCAQLSDLDARLQGLAGQQEQAEAETEQLAEQEQPRSLDVILGDLQRGEYERGQRDLERYLEHNPDHTVARAVLRQLEADPEQVLGQESHRYVVRPGDSYSALASRHLGDAGLFLLLARYNRSDNPSDLRVGEVIRLPGSPVDGEEAAASEMGTPGTPALRSLEPAPRPSPATAAALALPDRPLPAVGAAAASEGPSAEELQRQGMALLGEGKRESALSYLEAALARDAALEPAAERVPRLREELVTGYHQRAILHYRNQRLDEAIALWDRALAIDPTYEPSRSYRARALELQRRLSDL